MPALDTRVIFQARQTDANGDAQGPFADQFSLWAEVIWQRGSEPAVNGRLEGRQPVQMLLRDARRARLIDNAWRAVIASGPRKGDEFNITATAPAREPGFLNLQAVSGGSAG